MHNDGFHLIDNIIEASEVVNNCSSPSFFVVPDSGTGRKVRKIIVSSFTKAVGSVTVQLYAIRNGAEVGLLLSPLVYDTSTFFAFSLISQILAFSCRKY